MTHRGKDLNNLKDDFDQDFDKDSDVEVPAELVNKLHFEGFDDNLAEKVKNYNPSKLGENGGKKSKKEIYEEII